MSGKTPRHGLHKPQFLGEHWLPEFDENWDKIDQMLTGTAAGGGVTVEVQEDDVKVADASIINFEALGIVSLDVNNEGGGKVTVNISGSAAVAQTIDLPYAAWATSIASGQPAMPDGDDTNWVVIMFATPIGWVAATDIVIKTTWQVNQTGLMDLEYGLFYHAYDVDDSADTTIVGLWANTPTQPNMGVASRHDTVAITLDAVDIAADRAYRLFLRRNTGDANTGAASLTGIRIRATVNL